MKIRSLVFIIAILMAPGAAKADERADFEAANNAMMTGMDMTPTGDADRDFVAMMIPHHQGAIDMARVELRYGKDKELRALAAAIIKAQEGEIARMKAWQGKAGAVADKAAP